MSTMEASQSRRHASIPLLLLGALSGLIVAVIVVLNLHILVGLEEGYASTPAQVAEYSTVLAVVDILLIVGLAVLGAMTLSRLTRREQPAAHA